MFAVWGGGKSGAVVVYVLTEQEARPIGENDVVRSEAFLDGGWRGYDNEKTGSEAEGEDRTIFYRKIL